MHPAVAGIVGIGTLFIVAAIVYQLGKAPNTVPVTKSVVGGGETIAKTLFK
jgi:hypothetical protein